MDDRFTDDELTALLMRVSALIHDVEDMSVATRTVWETEARRKIAAVITHRTDGSNKNEIPDAPGLW